MNDQPFHLVVRFSDNLFSVGGVTEKHNEVVSKYGFVWFGKIGQTISQTRIDLLNDQIAKLIPTFVYLVQGNRRKSSFYQAQLLRIAKDLKRDQKEFIPDYYTKAKILKYISCWMKITKIRPIPSAEISSLKAVSSITPLEETLVRSSSGYFLVHESKKIF